MTPSLFWEIQLLLSPLMPCWIVPPSRLIFPDSSAGAVSWLWDFGDFTGSTLQNPSKIFENQTLFITNYTVKLFVTAPNGCVDSVEQTITVLSRSHFLIFRLSLTLVAVRWLCNFQWPWGRCFTIGILVMATRPRDLTRPILITITRRTVRFSRRS